MSDSNKHRPAAGDSHTQLPVPPPAKGQTSPVGSIAAGLAVVAVSVVLWWLLGVMESRYTLVSTARVAERVQNEINSELADRKNALRRMIHRWNTIPGIDDDEWLRDASYLVQDQPGYAWILRTNEKGWIDWTITAPPLPGTRTTPDVLSMPGMTDFIADIARSTNAQKLVRLELDALPPVRDILLVVLPHAPEDKDSGTIIAGLDSSVFFDAILRPAMTDDYILNIKKTTPQGNYTLYSTQAPGVKGVAKFSQEITAGISPVTWEISLAPTLQKVRADRSSLPMYVLGSGLMIALLLGYAIHQRQLAHQRETMATRLGRIMNQSSNEIYFFDADTLRFININAGGLKNLGYTAREAVRMHPYDIKPDFNEETFRKLLAPLERGEVDHLTFETHNQRKDGSTYPVVVNLQISRDSDPALYFAVIQDISERKRAEYERQRYMAMIDNNRDLIAVVDPQTQKFTFVNKGAVKALGYSEDELLEMTPDDLRPDGDAAELRAHGKDILSGKVDLSIYDVQYVTRDGNLLDLEVHLLPIVDFNGKKALLGIGRDITERKKSEAELERARYELERRARDLLRSNQELQQFAYAASHDLQEPLRMISSYLQLLEEDYDKLLDDEGREYIKFAVDGASRMRDLIYDLLAFSQVETQGKPFRNVDCTEVVDTALNDLSGMINESGVMITFENLPCVRGDFGQLVQVFTNLINNAVKYRSDKEPKIHIEAHGGDNDNIWEFSVIDNGIGIDENYHQKIFDIFKRLHTLDEYKGTGIGLALCKRIIERHGGSIGVHKNPHGGSIFTFTLSGVGKKKRHDQATPPTTEEKPDAATTDGTGTGA